MGEADRQAERQRATTTLTHMQPRERNMQPTHPDLATDERRPSEAQPPDLPPFPTTRRPPSVEIKTEKLYQPSISTGTRPNTSPSRRSFLLCRARSFLCLFTIPHQKRTGARTSVGQSEPIRTSVFLVRLRADGHGRLFVYYVSESGRATS